MRYMAQKTIYRKNEIMTEFAKKRQSSRKWWDKNRNREKLENWLAIFKRVFNKLWTKQKTSKDWEVRILLRWYKQNAKIIKERHYWDIGVLKKYERIIEKRLATD